MSDDDLIVDQIFRDNDETSMSLPNLESEPHLLISKVRKHYMDYLIKQLSLNYESNQRLLNKNIYLPSAIWRCAKEIEIKAAQSCMVAQIYSKNLSVMIKQLKRDTSKGKLNKNLYDCLRIPPQNEKKLQASLDIAIGTLQECKCQCHCYAQKRRRKVSKSLQEVNGVEHGVLPEKLELSKEQNKIPVIVNSQLEHTLEKQIFKDVVDFGAIPAAVPDTTTSLLLNNFSPRHLESQDSDELMMQLEKLFQSDANDEDLFDSAFCDTVESTTLNDSIKKQANENLFSEHTIQRQNSLIENQAVQIKSLDERLVSLAGLLVNSNDTNDNNMQQTWENSKAKPFVSSKWICEEYFLKMRLFELMDEVRDHSRSQHARIQRRLVELFDDDSDEDGVVSPLDDTPEFIISCKERIAPWVVKVLTPYYVKGRIRGKALFKSLAKHLIRLIYQCSHYPREHEVNSFVTDFLDNHKMIRCEADFKQFKIQNI